MTTREIVFLIVGFLVGLTVAEWRQLRIATYGKLPRWLYLTEKSVGKILTAAFFVFFWIQIPVLVAGAVAIPFIVVLVILGLFGIDPLGLG